MSVAVTQLAQRQSLTTAGQAGVTAPVGSGASTALTFEFGTISGGTLNAGVYTGASFTQNGSIATRTVTIDASNNTLQGIRDAINAANVGVNASILNVGGTNPYRLVLQSAPGGSAASLRIGVSGDAALAGLLAYDPAGGQSLTQTVAAQDANLTVNGLEVTSGSNTLTDAIQGVTLTLAKVGSTTVTVGRDPAAAQTAAQGFVKAYNDLNTLLHDLTRFDAEKDGSGALVGDSAARTIQSQLRSALSSALAGGNSNTLRVLSQVGMSFQKDGSLQLDSGKLSQALASDPAGVARLFASGGAASDSLVKIAGSSSATVPGSYGVEISQLATRGQLVGSTAAALIITAAVNDVLTVTVDGTSATLTLPAGTYTPSALAAQVQSLANASSSLRAANAQVTLSEAAGVFTLTSKRYGSGSTLSVGGNAAATLFGAAPTATPGVDRGRNDRRLQRDRIRAAAYRRGRLSNHRTGAGCHGGLDRQPRNGEFRTRLRGTPRRSAARGAGDRWRDRQPHQRHQRHDQGSRPPARCTGPPAGPDRSALSQAVQCAGHAHEQHDRHQHLSHSAAAAAPTAAELERVGPMPNQIFSQES